MVVVLTVFDNTVNVRNAFGKHVGFIEGGDWVRDSGDGVEIRAAHPAVLHSDAKPRTVSIIIKRRHTGSTSVTIRVSPLCPHRITKRPLFRMFGCWMLVVATVVAIVFVLPGTAKDVWEKPGCHKVGHTRKISIPGCVEFHMRTNACRGFCESYAIPSGPKANPEQPVTSVGQCCNIMDTEDVEANVLCVDGMKTLTFKSATSCACYHCKKD